MPRKTPAKLKKVTLNVFGLGGAEWEDDPTIRQAAWELYIELATRISLEGLEAKEGVLREALTSLHSLFPATREILKKAGPDVGTSSVHVGGIAIAVLNRGLRPFLSKWHPLLAVWESRRDPQTSVQQHEQTWSDAAKMRAELEQLRSDLNVYACALAEIAGAG